MRKIGLVLPVLLLFGFVLAACNNDDDKGNEEKKI